MRIAFQSMAGVLGGAQSIHANGYDEAVCLPTDQSMLLSVRTEQIIALETNVTNTIDPLGGSYFVESLTNEIEERAWEYVAKIEEQGGLAKAITNGWIHREYKTAIIDYERRLRANEINIVGVNKFRLEKEPYKVPIFRYNPKSGDILTERIKAHRAKRDPNKVAKALANLEEVMRTEENTVPAIMEAVKAQATPGELAAIPLKIFGNWTYPIGI